MTININQVAIAIAKQTGQSHNNVHASISKLIKTLCIDITALDYKIADGVFTEIQINEFAFVRGKSNKWMPKDEHTNREYRTCKSARSIANQMAYFCSPAQVIDSQEKTEALVFEYKGSRLVIPTTDDPDDLYM